MKEKVWFCRERKIPLDPPLIMGVLNVTPDSFFDGGRYFEPDAAFDRAREMVRQGADIIDVGGESTRPGACEVEVKEELKRVVPVICRITAELDVAVSIDTRHLPVAEAALNAGAHIINNIMPLDESGEFARLAVQSRSGLVLMHMRGSPETMTELTDYDNVLEDVAHRLQECVEFALAQGVARKQIVIDPGIGFAKKTIHNLELLAHLERIREIAPVLVGVSHKRFIGELCSSPDVEDRIGGSIGAALMSILHGASIVRVHDVKETRQAVTVADAIENRKKQG
ncbi:MAG: dihydropteroate synthase [Kiritimatiellia bacterium]